MAARLGTAGQVEPPPSARGTDRGAPTSHDGPFFQLGKKGKKEHDSKTGFNTP